MKMRYVQAGQANRCGYRASAQTRDVTRSLRKTIFKYGVFRNATEISAKNKVIIDFVENVRWPKSDYFSYLRL